MGFDIEILFGDSIESYIDYISCLRIETFREFPYLYVGELEYEQAYIKSYQSDKQAMLAIARSDGNIAGISTGIPLGSDSEITSDAKEAFKNENINDYYYYREVIVHPEYRGLGLTTKLYTAQDAVIRTRGYKFTSILTVVRALDHPLKPKGYQSTDTLWEHLGFFKKQLRVKYHWPTIQMDGSVKDQDHELELWVKNLAL